MALLPNTTEAQQAAFEDECFACWLNRIDARIDYDERRKLGRVNHWRDLFDAGECEADAIEARRQGGKR